MLDRELAEASAAWMIIGEPAGWARFRVDLYYLGEAARREVGK
jgi:hypothetical protein